MLRRWSVVALAIAAEEGRWFGVVFDGGRLVWRSVFWFSAPRTALEVAQTMLERMRSEAP